VSLGVPHLEQYWARNLAPATETADRILLNGLQLGLEEANSYLLHNTPTLEQFESWILAINGGSLDPALVARLNAAIDGTLDPGTPTAAALTTEDLDYWDRHGYVVLHDAVTPAQSQAAAQAIYEFMGVDPANPDTWYNNPRGHSIWVPLLRHPAFRANRESPRIHAAFAQLWGRTDLWPTIDQGGFNPPERPGWTFPGPHLHWDVSIAKPTPMGTQGILYLTDTAADQGAFTCVPGFHRCLAKWLADLPPDADPRDWKLLETLPAMLIAGRAGDLIIWHQALPHGSSPNRSPRPRVAQYINLLPSRWDVNPVWL
jgi:Phytanoyl-CoA dioxygenase (PhyH)